jgi:nitrile hydratase subunit beta
VWFDGAVEGVRDLGGRQGFGPIEVEPDEPVWHEPWEAHTFALQAAAMMHGLYGGPVFRHGIERMVPGHYLTSSYYEQWLTGLATVLVERGHIDHADLEARTGGRFPLALPVTADLTQIDPEPVPARLSVGDRVRVREIGFAGHTRCPGFVMGRRGMVVRDDGPAAVPEVEGHLGRRVMEHVYSVRFAATELWPESTDGHAVIHVDLYERYLDAG